MMWRKKLGGRGGGGAVAHSFPLYTGPKMKFPIYMQEICRIELNPLHISFIRMTFSPYPLLEVRRKY